MYVPTMVNSFSDKRLPGQENDSCFIDLGLVQWPCGVGMTKVPSGFARPEGVALAYSRD